MKSITVLFVCAAIAAIAFAKCESSFISIFDSSDFQDALHNAKPGAEIFLGDGTHNFFDPHHINAEQFVMTTSGDKNCPIVIHGYDYDPPLVRGMLNLSLASNVIVGNISIALETDYPDIGIASYGTNVVLESIGFQNDKPVESHTRALYLKNAVNVAVFNCSFYEYHTSVHVDSTQSSSFEQCNFGHKTGSTDMVFESSSDNVVSECAFFGEKLEDASWVTLESSDRNLFTDNYFQCNNQKIEDGIYLSGCKDNVFKKNFVVMQEGTYFVFTESCEGTHVCMSNKNCGDGSLVDKYNDLDKSC